MTIAAVWNVLIARKYGIRKYVLSASMTPKDEKTMVDRLLYAWALIMRIFYAVYYLSPSS